MSESGDEGVLVVAGEASGDRIAGLAAAALARGGVRCFGIGGPACRAAGVETIADTGRLGAMGLGDVAGRLPAIAAAGLRLLARVRHAPPRAALLVNFTELNQRLGRLLRARGTRVLWCVAPQVWAWRAGRLRTLHGAVDRLAVILPFEEGLWRGAGYDARYVGHPALEAPAEDRGVVRGRLGIAAGARAVAVLPGSRAGEVRRLAGVLCEAAARLVAEGSVDAARVILAPGLEARARGIAEAAARAAGIAVVGGDAAHGAAGMLGGFDVSLCASGTASLEAALAGAAPVVAYRMDGLAFAVARRLVRTPHIALPNVLLGRRAFPELVQDEVTVGRVAEAARGVLGRSGEAPGLAEELRGGLVLQGRVPFGERVAGMMLPWVG